MCDIIAKEQPKMREQLAKVGVGSRSWRMPRYRTKPAKLWAEIGCACEIKSGYGRLLQN